jgi:pSer/pThr/pTyr-binding forkhead associated (FHA) protein
MSIETILISALVGIITSGITAYITTGLRMREEKQKWRKEFAERYAEVLSKDSAHAERLAVQFGVGVLKFRTKGQTGTEKRFLPPNSRLVAGRGLNNDFVLIDSNVSRRHCAFFTDDTEVYIEDLGSITGTLLNGEKVKGRTRIKTDDEIRIGDTEFLFYKLDGR